MSCIDATTCASNHIINRINCNFTIYHIIYTCHPSKTCKRTDGLYDCCSSNISDCTIQLYDMPLLPTIQPTTSTNLDSLCEYTCNIAPNSSKCYWYESQNIDISCRNKDNNYCCSHSHLDCCQTSIQYIFIVFGSILFIILVFLLYKYTILTYTQVVPQKPISYASTNRNIHKLSIV